MPKIKDKNHPAIFSIKNYLARNLISREDLAERAEVGLATINRLMSGDIPRDDTLRKIEKNLGIKLTDAFQMVAHPDLGEYPKSWCMDLGGDYLCIRQNRWLDKTDIISVFPVTFSWCDQRPGLKMVWEYKADPKNIKTQLGYVAMTSRDGALSITSNTNGVISSTHLQRVEGQTRLLAGMHCGLGHISKNQKAIISQVVAYARRDWLPDAFDTQVWPGAKGYNKLRSILSEIEGSFCFMVKPFGSAV